MLARYPLWIDKREWARLHRKAQFGMKNVPWRVSQIDIEMRGIFRGLSESDVCVENAKGEQKKKVIRTKLPCQERSFEFAKAYHTCEPAVADAANLAGTRVKWNDDTLRPSVTISV